VSYPEEYSVSLGEFERVLFSLCGGDIARYKEYRDIPLRKIYQYYYISRVQKLTELVNDLKRMKEK
jgi:hypothetical protein